jgi:MFS family permease
MPGSPATPEHPFIRRVFYFLIGVLLGLTGGFANGMLTVNLPQIQGDLGLTPSEGAWLTAAYSMTNVWTSMVLVKARQQFGIQRFVRPAIFAFVLLNVVQVVAHSYGTELAVRAASGVVGSALSSLAMFYVMQAMPAPARIAGAVIGVGITQIALPLARVISPLLLWDGNVTNIFLFELGLGMAALGAVLLLPLPPSNIIDAFEPLDFLTLALFAPGVAMLAAVLSQGRIVWWTTPWIGVTLGLGLLLIAVALFVEHNRANPMLNTRWIGTGYVIRFAVIAATMRLLLAEQSTGATGLMTALGMINDQMITLFTWASLASVAALVIGLRALDPSDLLKPILLSLALIAVGAFLDSHSTNLTRPMELYVSQSMLAFAAIYFLGPTMMGGLFKALARGPSHIVSFAAVFSIAQSLGGLAGSALLGSFQIVREKYHSAHLVEAIRMTDPLMAERVRLLGGAYSRVLVDPALRPAEGAVQLSQQVTREATVLAYNDMFLLASVVAALLFVWFGVRWIYYRINNINPLAEDLAALQRLRQEQSR